MCGGHTGTVRENGAQLCVLVMQVMLVMLGPLWKMEHKCVC